MRSNGSGVQNYYPFTRDDFVNIINTPVNGAPFKPGSCGFGAGRSILTTNSTPTLSSLDGAPPGSDGPVTGVGSEVSWSAIVESSLACWQQLGFDANATNLIFSGVVNDPRNVVDNLDIQALERVNEIGPTTPGMFNTPVCQVFDLLSAISLFVKANLLGPVMWERQCRANSASSCILQTRTHATGVTSWESGLPLLSKLLLVKDLLPATRLW